jgi:GAF domain-containing protein
MAGAGRRELGAAADLGRELTESRAREAALAEVLGLMRRAPGELATVLDAVLDRAASLCGAERASIHLLDGEVYRTAAFWGPRNPEYERVAYDTTRKSGRETLIGRTAFERAVIHIPDVLTDAEYTARDLQRLAGYRTMLGVPLFRGETVAGVFVLTRNEVRPFSDPEIALVRAFADQAVVAVENARLIKGTKEALDRQTAISEVLEDMSRSVFDLDRVLESVALSAVRLCAADNGSIARIASDGWRLVANVGDIDQESMEQNWGNQPIEADRRSLTGRVLMDKRTTTIVDALADPEYDAGAGLFNVRSIIGVPLTRGEDIVGVLILRRQEPKPFTPEEIHLLETFADQASIAIENVRLFDETKDALERQTALAEILQIISKPHTDLKTIADAVARSAARYCAAENATVFLAEGDSYRMVAATGPLPNLGPELQETTRLTMNGRVLLEGRTIHVVDLQSSDEFPRGRELAIRSGFRTGLTTPILRGEQAIGTITLRRKDVRPFSDYEISLLEAFAAQGAIAIENVRLFNETKEALEQQTAVSELLGTISRSAFDLDRVLTAIIERATQLAGADDGTIREVDGNTSRIVASTKSTPPALAAWIASLAFGGPHRQSVTGRVAFARAPVQVPDVDQDPEYTVRLPGSPTRAVLGVPLLRSGELIGVMLLRRNTAGAFSNQQIQVVQTFADQAVIAMENVRLFNETKEALERQTATSEILRVMAGSPTEVQPVLDAIAENAARVCGATDAHVYRVEGEVLRQWAHVGPIPILAPGESLPLSRGSIIGRSILDRRAIHIEDATGLDPAEYPISAQLQRRWGYRTVLSVPLIRHGVGIGGIAIRRTELQPFTPKQIELLETFADQAAIAIANVELFQTVERQRGELSRFLSPQVAALVTSEQGAKMLEGHRRQITVAFCDLRNFTAFAETAEPEEVLGVLRDYHRAMGELIVEHQGTLEHFAGDGMMVFFNDPLPVERHELQAVRMTCAMRERFDQMARTWQKRGYELGFGVGIATGYATLGRIGFEGRYDYGAIGNVVILAQRLSAEAKAGQILLSQRVQAAVEADAETTAVGDLTLKGFTRPIPAFAAVSLRTPTPAR